MTYIPIAIMSVASFYYPDPMLLYAIAGFMLIFSTAFYFLTYNLIAGLSVSNLDTATPWKDIWTIRLSHLIALVALYHAGDAYLYIAIYVLPWLIVNTMSDTLNTLIQFGVVEIADTEE